MTAVSLEISCVTDEEIRLNDENQIVHDKVRKVFDYGMGCWIATCTAAILFEKVGIADYLDTVFSKNISGIVSLGAFTISSLAATILIPSKYSLLKQGSYGAFCASKALMMSTLIRGYSNRFMIQSIASLALAGVVGSSILHLQKKGIDTHESFFWGSLLGAYGLEYVNKGLSILVFPAIIFGMVLKSAKKEAGASHFDPVDAAMRIDIEYCLLKGIINKCSAAWDYFYEKWQASTAAEDKYHLDRVVESPL